MLKEILKILKPIAPALKGGTKTIDQKVTEKLELVKFIMQYAVEATGLVLIVLAVFFREDLAQIHGSLALYLIIFGVIVTFLRVIGTFLKQTKHLFASKIARKPASKPASKTSKPKNTQK